LNYRRRRWSWYSVRNNSPKAATPETRNRSGTDQARHEIPALRLDWKDRQIAERKAYRTKQTQISFLGFL
jgi:hypothetical protein